jgi:ribosomal protein S1
VQISVFDQDDTLIDDDGCFVAFRELGLKRKPEKLMGQGIFVAIGDLQLHGPRGKRFTFSRIEAVKRRMADLQAQIGAVIEAVVVAIVANGVLADIGNHIVGKVSTAELSSLPQSPRQLVAVGDRIEVKLLGVCGENITLSRRQVFEHSAR